MRMVQHCYITLIILRKFFYQEAKTFKYHFQCLELVTFPNEGKKIERVLKC